MLPLILTLDVAGNPHEWVSYETAAYYYSKGQIAWDFGESCTLHGGISRATLKQSTLEINTIIAIKGKVLNSAQLLRYNNPTITSKALYSRDQHLCAYCGNKFFEGQLTRDHVIPTSKGGENSWMNLVTACYYCNNSKGDRTPEEWGNELLYLPYIPNRAEYLILTNRRRIIACQMEFLLSRVSKHSRVLQAS